MNTNETILQDVDYLICDVHYVGTVSINTITGEVDILGLCNDDGLYCRRDGYNVISVIDYIKGLALRDAGLKQFYHRDFKYGYYAPSNLFYNYRGREDVFVLCSVAQSWDDEYFYKVDFQENTYKDEDGERSFNAPWVYWESLYYCEHCGCYVPSEYWDSSRDMCKECSSYNVIENYGESHNHNDNPVFFTAFNNSVIVNPNIDNSDFAGLGFELEIDCDHRREDNNDVARVLCEKSGLFNDELRFARDGSLNYGFEIISQPHTIKAFWNRREQWEKMLSFLSHKGYTSHDAGTCGLHIHVSRHFFGKTKSEQDRAIAKIFSFYNDNWNDLARASRRDNFNYCEQNGCDYSIYSNSKYLKWKKGIRGNGGHYVALNNNNRYTFEFRLGRGTLNKLSFFSWIDLTLTIAKNARRITINQIETNDILSWLSGIKESTARYLYRRGSFRSYVLELFPSIAWEYDTNDNE